MIKKFITIYYKEMREKNKFKNELNIFETT